MSLLMRRRALLSTLTKVIKTVLSKLPIILTASSDNGYVLDYKLYGESVQNGTPTPETPVDVESVGYIKNVFLIDDLINAPSGSISSSSGNVYEVTNLLELKVKSNTNYTISSSGLIGSLEGSSDINRALYINTADSANCVFDGHSVTIKTDDAGVIKIGLFGNRTNANAVINKVAKIQVEEGLVVTKYAPFGKYVVPIRVSGNVFNYDKVSIYSYGSGGQFTKQDNGFTFNNPKTFNNYMTMNSSCLNLKPNTKYICRAIITPTNNGSTTGEAASGSMTRSLRLQTVAQTFDSKAIYIVQGYNLGKLYEGEVITRFKTPADLSSYKYITTRLSDKISVTFKDITIMEDVGQTIDKYEPYQEPIITDIYLDEPLRKAGTYADYIDFENQVVVRNVKKFELKTTDNIMRYTWLQKRGLYVSDKLDDSYNRNANALSNRNYNSWNDAQNATNPSGMWVGAGNPFFYWNGILDVLGLTTIGEFKTWLADNPTYVLYGSKKPITTPITLPKLPVFKGTTIYSVDTNIQPSNMEVTYYSNER